MDRRNVARDLGIACLWAIALVASPALAGDVDDHGWPSNGLVARWSGEGNAKDSAGENHGKAMGPVKYATGVSGRAFKLDGKSAYITMGSPAALQITGNQTIAMWLKPDRRKVRQNPISKAVGGEGTVNINADGRMTYYYGTTGGRNWPWAALTTRSGVKVGRWQHVALVRNFNTRTLTWYVNGVKDSQGPTKYAAAKAGSQPLYIGKGYVDNYCGLIDEVGIWNRALSADEIGMLVGVATGDMPPIARRPKLDTIRSRDGTVLYGTLRNERWSVKTPHGLIPVPAARVVGFVSVSADEAAAARPSRETMKMLLVDGQILVGILSPGTVQLKLPDGQVTKVRVDEIKQCGYRIGPDRPALIPTSRDPAGRFPITAVLDNGARVAVDARSLQAKLASAWGTIDLGPEIVVGIVPTGSGHRVTLTDSSTISGALTPTQVKLNLALGTEITVDRRSISRLARPDPPVKPAQPTTVSLRNGDRLVGKLTAKALALRTEFGDLDLPPAGLLNVEFADDGAAVKITMQNATVLKGTLAAKALTVVLGSGIKLTVKTTDIASISLARKLPPETVKRLETLVKQLGSASLTKRQAAIAELAGMGRGILAELRRLDSDEDPTFSQAMRQVIDIIEGRRTLRNDPMPGGPVLEINSRGDGPPAGGLR